MDRAAFRVLKTRSDGWSVIVKVRSELGGGTGLKKIFLVGWEIIVAVFREDLIGQGEQVGDVLL